MFQGKTRKAGIAFKVEGRGPYLILVERCGSVNAHFYCLDETRPAIPDVQIIRAAHPCRISVWQDQLPREVLERLPCLIRSRAEL